MFHNIDPNNDDNLQTPLLKGISNYEQTTEVNSIAKIEHFSLGDIAPSFKSTITGRLQEIKIYQLHKNGDTDFLDLPLRGLYNYVIKCIKPEKMFPEKVPLRKIRYRSISHDDPMKLFPTHYNVGSGIISSHISHNERLGVYLHPRDMRRLITPYSSINEPQFIIRRHVMLLNLYPIRVIILRDRLLFLVPDGLDNHTFMEIQQNIRESIEESNDMSISFKIQDPKSDEDLSSCTDSNSEWREINNMQWITSVNFELKAVDGILQTVLAILMNDLEYLSIKAGVEIKALTYGEIRPAPLLQKLRILKDNIKEMEARVNGYMRTLNLVLEKDEDMALMNVSRLMTHPERFRQPVSGEVLVEESDEPELILESHLHDALSIANSLDILKSQVLNSEEQVAMKMVSQLAIFLSILTIYCVLKTFLKHRNL